MEPVTDPERVRQLAAQREDENWRFRSFLKAADLSIRRIDSIVHRHYEDVRAQIDCTKCGNCCKEVGPLLSRADILRLAAAVGSPEPAFVERYVKPAEEKKRFLFKGLPCPFLQDNRCSVYDSRPRDCRSYPHLHKREFVFRLMAVVANCSVCPIVFNVYELLKAELWHHGRY